MPSQDHRTQGERFENHYAEFDYEARRTRQEAERQSPSATPVLEPLSPDSSGSQPRFVATPSGEVHDEYMRGPQMPFGNYGPHLPFDLEIPSSNSGIHPFFGLETPQARSVRSKRRYIVHCRQGRNPYFIGWNDPYHGRGPRTPPYFPYGMSPPHGVRHSFDPDLYYRAMPSERLGSRASPSCLHYPNGNNKAVVCNCGDLHAHQGALPVHNREIIDGAMRYFGATGNTTCTKEQWRRYMPRFSRGTGSPSNISEA